MKTFCILEAGFGAPSYLSMDTLELCLDHHQIAQRRLGIPKDEEIEVFAGDPRGEEGDAPYVVGYYSEAGGLREKLES